MTPRALSLLLLWLGCSAFTVSAQDYPVRAVRVMVGGGADLIGRILGRELTNIWRQQVVIEDRPGAGGGIAAEYIAKSPADG